MLHLNRTSPQPNHASHSQALSSPNLPPPSISIKSITGRLCVHQPGVTSSVIGAVRALTSGKQSLANTWRRAVFPHWLSPTTTILHFTLWLGSMPDFRDNFWQERLSFIDFSRDSMEMNKCGPGATDDAFREPHNLLFSVPLCVSLPVRVPPPMSPPVLCRCVPFACIYKVTGANGCSLDETRPSCRTCRQESAPIRPEMRN